MVTFAKSLVSFGSSELVAVERSRAFIVRTMLINEVKFSLVQISLNKFGIIRR